jgi:hypothetical protein
MTLYIPHAAVDQSVAAPAGSAEALFMEFLQAAPLYYLVAYEPDTFPLPGWNGRMGGFTPDLRIDGRFGWSTNTAVYLELTSADLYARPSDLPLAVRRRNRRQSSSRQAHISPTAYLQRKRDKIAEAQRRYRWLKVELLTAADQANYLADPEALFTLIERLRS